MQKYILVEVINRVGASPFNTPHNLNALMPEMLVELLEPIFD
jgi:hypothetical protein